MDGGARGGALAVCSGSHYMLYVTIIWWHMCRLQFYDRFAKFLDSMFSSCASMFVCFVISCVRSPKLVGSRTCATRSQDTSAMAFT